MTSTPQERKTRKLAIVVGTAFAMLGIIVLCLAITSAWQATSIGVIGAILLLIGVFLLAVADADPIKKLVDMWPNYQDWCKMFGHAGAISAAALAILAIRLVP